ncbi:MAG: hypothetical protein Q8O00_05585 [Holophaga sp.]|nr:hypothetical protein [Holophaga sp.]
MSILLCADFLMDSEAQQRWQLDWIQKMLTRPIGRAVGSEPLRFLGGEPGESEFDRREFFRLSGLAFDKDSRFLPFLEEEVSEASLSFLSAHFGPDTFLVAYELSEPTRQILERIGIPFLDVWLHPVRYTDDLLFGFYASDRSVHQELASFNVDPDLFFLYADRIKVETALCDLLPALRPDSAFFAGQTPTDKALLQGKRMLSVLDYKAEFAALCRSHPQVYFSKHPHVRSLDDEILHFLSEFGNVEVCSHPAYLLLSSDRIKRVMTVSSSVGVEARYFGKPTTILFKPVINLGDRYENREYISVFHEFLSPHFWSQILRPVMSTQDCPRIAFFDAKDKLRSMFNLRLSYRATGSLDGQTARLLDAAAQVEELKLRQDYRDLLAAASHQGHRDLVICGAGKAGRLAAAEARALDLNLLAVTDRNPAAHGTFIEGAPVVPLEKALRLGCVCVIGSTVFQAQIRAEVEVVSHRLGLETPLIFQLGT